MTESNRAQLRNGEPQRSSPPSSLFKHPDGIWHHLSPLNSIENQNMSGDEMEIEFTPRLSTLDTQHFIEPLKDVAEKVGREVELFAEQLDSFRPKTNRILQSAQHAAIQLTSEYTSIANTAAQSIGKLQPSELEKRFKEEWYQRIQHVNAKSTSNGTDGFAADLRLQASANDDAPQKWREESNTWQLVWTILKNQAGRVNSVAKEKQIDALLETQSNDRFKSDGRTWATYLFATRARERVALLKWLESTAEQTGRDISLIEEELHEKNGQGQGFHSYGWLDTKARIKGQKRMRLWSVSAQEDGIPDIGNSDNTALLVTQLDPDAVTRQARQLERQDSISEASFWIVCWEMLRRGCSMDELRDWCEDHNEFARAISLGAQAVSKSGQFSTGINARFRWRRACLYLAQRGGLNDYERAVYGLLGGDYDSVTPVCKCWEDFVYAKQNQLLVREYEEYILTSYANSVPPEEIRDFGLSIPPLAESDDFYRGFDLNTLLHTQDYSLGASQSLTMIQNAILADKVPSLMWEQGIALSRAVNKTDSISQLVPKAVATTAPSDLVVQPITHSPEVLRILAHLFIMYKDLGSVFGEDDHLVAVENVLCAYINFLRQNRKLTLIPLYASQLSEIRCTLTMARVLPDIHESGLRVQMFKLMEIHNINIPQVLETQYEFALDYSRFDEDKKSTFANIELLEHTKLDLWPGKRIKRLDAKVVEANDDRLIRSAEWYIHLPGHWQMTFLVLSDLAVRFLKAGLIHAATELYKRLPYADVSASKISPLTGRVVNLMEEDSDESDDEITPRLSRNSPFYGRHSIHPITRRSGASAKKKVTNDILRQQSKRYWEVGQLVTAIGALQAWRKVEDSHLEESKRSSDKTRHNKLTREALDNLNLAMEPLLQKGFLCAASLSKKDGQDELRKLRQAYLPEVIIAYNSALHSAAHLLTREQLLQSLELATLVADDEELMACFKATGRMKELVTALALSSKAMLKLNKSSDKIPKKKKGRLGRGLAIWDVKA